MPLLTYDQYKNVHHKTPYAFTIQSGPQHLYYFGERHSFNPSDEQWITEKVFWNGFANNTKDQKRIVFVEGNKPPQEETEESSILKHGGRGLATYLASRLGIDTFSPEPGEKIERDALEKEFTRKQIQYYYFAVIVHQWTQNNDPKPDFEEYMSRYAKMDADVSGWTDFYFSLEAMKKVHAEFFDTPFDQHDSRFFYNLIDPTQDKTIFNIISRLASEIRDRHIVGQIEKYIKDGYSVYVQYGATHAVMQEPLLREVLL